MALSREGTLDEIVLSIDGDNRRVAYTIASAALPFDHHSAAMQLRPDGTGGTGGTVLSWTTDFLPTAPRWKR